MGTADASEGWDLVVGPDGSICADQLAGLGLCPGACLRVIAEVPPGSPRSGYGLLAGEPTLGWADYAAGSRQAIADAEAGPTHPVT